VGDARFEFVHRHFDRHGIVGGYQADAKGRGVDRHHAVVAYHDHGIDGFARAVDPAVRPDERVDGPRSCSASDTAIAEIEYIAGGVEKSEVTAGRKREYTLQPIAEHTACETRIEPYQAITAHRPFGQHAVGGGHELHARARLGHSGGERAHRDVKSVVPAQQLETEIGIHDPLGGELHLSR
jgi:hypothetical protein